MSINQVLHQIQANLCVPKNRFNKFGNYSYRNAEDIVDAVKALLPEGAILYLTDDVVVFNNRFYVKATAALKVGDTIISAQGWAREPDTQKGMAEPQITGAASSYARKYALNGLFAIDDGVDADSQNNGQPLPKPASVDSVDVEQEYNTYVKKLNNFKSKSEFIQSWNSSEDTEIRARIYKHRKDLYVELNTIKDRILEKYKEAEASLLEEFKAA